MKIKLVGKAGKVMEFATTYFPNEIVDDIFLFFFVKNVLALQVIRANWKCKSH